jgi:hypothetical protein
VWSFCIPIALVEAAHPGLSDRRWLNRPGLVATTLLYLAAAALILSDHLRTETDHASTAQLAGSVSVVAVLLLFAGTVGRRPAARTGTPVPRPAVVGVVSLVAAFGFNAVPPSWWGVAAGLSVLAAATVSVTVLARSSRWGTRHVVALVTGALVARAVVGFLSFPEGVATGAKYAHNVGFLAGALLLGAWVARRSAAATTQPPAAPVGPPAGP